MTSSPPSPTRTAPTTCFVFCHLPGQTAPVVCGRFEQRASGRDVVGLFAYGRSYLDRKDAVPLDPVGLPLQRGTFPPTARLDGVYGPLRDAGPDAWGRRVIERARGVRTALTEIEYLLAGGDDRTGALTFGETLNAPTPAKGHHLAVSLPDLLAAAELLEAEGALTPETQRAAELLLDGVTMGGARPKAVIADQDALWLAKFPGREDRFDMAAVEAGLLTLARDCGMRVPEHRTIMVGRKRVLLVRRFDREGSLAVLTRARYLSALTLLDADETVSTEWSYLRLAEELRRRSIRPDEDRRELFRRMVFNALVSNGDDHPRNHAIIAWKAEDWRLSPLFDVVPTAREGTHERHLALIAGEYGRIARRVNLTSAVAQFRLTPDEAHEIINSMQDTLRTSWEDTCRHHGATMADLAAVRHAIVPAGFEDEVPESV